ncbi:hypothetical protein MmiEs2_16540 [Methanimicrococcus stummii]|uniref:Uncharacterized protein n=1 Tax=Methanimicrococcus stummii TaxID=3028294 RepID=A0AA96VC68_9EURY|nr:hypothetical protein MmiEs2_16540 [Methanimicrococcus sp. Es2]
MPFDKIVAGARGFGEFGCRDGFAVKFRQHRNIVSAVGYEIDIIDIAFVINVNGCGIIVFDNFLKEEFGGKSIHCFCNGFRFCAGQTRHPRINRGRSTGKGCIRILIIMVDGIRSGIRCINNINGFAFCRHAAAAYDKRIGGVARNNRRSMTVRFADFKFAGKRCGHSDFNII